MKISNKHDIVGSIEKVAEKVKFKENMQKTLVIVLIVVIVVLSGVVIWQNLGNKTPVESNLPQENDKVYSNTEVGIVLEYPANLLITENKINIGDASAPINLYSLGIYDGEISKFENRVFYFTETNGTVEGEGMTDVDPSFSKKIIVSGIDGYTRLIESMKDGSSLYITPIKKDGKIYQFVGNGPIFDQIISTFKFTK